MTIGQRIAQKRKELGLSQESLGEQLGVSRQAIYKWESDATLPEIEKLVALSRIFSVPVGWLLGEEELAAGADEELTPTQLKMVQEIVSRYLSATRPAWPQPSEEVKAKAMPQADPGPEVSKEERTSRRWPWIALVACVAIVSLVFINLFDRLDRVTNNYNALQSSINNIQGQVSSQIGTITNRVEEILNGQNELTAEWSAEIRDINIPENTVTFHVRVVPKTYKEGMTAVFVARSDGKTYENGMGAVGPENAFDGTVTCPLTDEIVLSVIFRTEEKQLVDGEMQTQMLQQTQRLEQYDSLYSNTFPGIIFLGNLWMEEQDGVIPADGEDKEYFFYGYDEDSNDPWRAKAADIKVGLFKDGKLVQWYREELRTVIYNGEHTERLWYVWDETVLDESSIYCEAAVVTDEYGRVRVYADTPIQWSAGDWHHVSGGGAFDPTDHTFDSTDWEF